MTYIKTNVPGWVKDTETGAVLNTDFTRLDQLKQARIKNREINALKEDVEKLKKTVAMLCIQLGLKT